MARRSIFIILLSALLLSALSACSSSNSGSSGSDVKGMENLKMAPMSDMPAEVKNASVSVQEAYRFAVANPEVLDQIPCYCGCGAMGHKSNRACYVKSDEGGKITFDQHALGCSICVDITRDTMRMLAQGKTVKEIKASIDKTYSQYGPSNIPE